MAIEPAGSMKQELWLVTKHMVIFGVILKNDAVLAEPETTLIA